MELKIMEKVVIRFDGGLAATGKLHFYESSRSQYALARILNTLEHFRRTGNVAQIVSSRNYVEEIVGVPEYGSFIEEIFIHAAKEVIAIAVNIPLSSLMSSVWGLMSPRRETLMDY
jgi:hypothetical protein